MILCDINVLVYAFREDAPDHPRYRLWLEDRINDDQAFGIPDLVFSGFLRIVTHPRIFKPATPGKKALDFIHSIRKRPNYFAINPGPRHFEIFCYLCEEVGASGNLVPDAYFAALAIETGSEWITTDNDFSRFPKLKWRHPLQR